MSRQYIPKPGTGAHSLLVGLYKAAVEDNLLALTKEQLIGFSNHHSTSNSHYHYGYHHGAGRPHMTAWTSIKSLLEKGLVERHVSRNSLYSLTTEGKDLAKKLVQLTSQPGDQVVNLDEESCDPFAETVLHAGTYDIMLIVDQREQQDMYKQLQSHDDIKIDRRLLAVGDFLWVARPKNAQPLNRTKDLVLDFVVERKRLDDLASSVKDGRWEDQKNRLKSCGVRRPTYLIEYYKYIHGRLNASALNQIVMHTEMIDGLDVERMKGPAETLDYLVQMTRSLIDFYKNTDLVGCTNQLVKEKLAHHNQFMTFAEFQSSGSKIKNWTVREMFAKQLIQIRGMSGPKAALVIRHYPTLRGLLDEYKRLQTEKQREELLASIDMGTGRKLGIAISRKVYACYN